MFIFIILLAAIDDSCQDDYMGVSTDDFLIPSLLQFLLGRVSFSLFICSLIFISVGSQILIVQIIILCYHLLCWSSYPRFGIWDIFMLALVSFWRMLIVFFSTSLVSGENVPGSFFVFHAPAWNESFAKEALLSSTRE